MGINFKENVQLASDRIKADIKRTPLEHSLSLSQLTGAKVFLKWESEQLTGSFKLRGALNKLRSLDHKMKEKGVVSASTGNHGLGVSYAASLEGIDLTLILPSSVRKDKRTRLEEYGARLIEYGKSCEKAEIYGRKLAVETGRTYISPYNDEEIIFGQGTVGLEIFEDLPRVEAVLVAIGGGGLISGIAGYLKSFNPMLLAVGVEPVNSAFMQTSIRAGKLVEIEERETVADAVAGGIEPGSLTFPLCKKLVDSFFTVEETLIKKSMALLREEHGRIVEGAGALPLAGLIMEQERFKGKDVVLVISGGNISPEAFSHLTRF